jgi:galactosamine-6-phosphate isomerase
MMDFQYLKDYDEMSRIAQVEFEKSIEGVAHPKVILATGNSPLGLYRNLVSSGKSFPQLSVIKLDEWLGIPMEHSATCEYFLQQEFIVPLQIPSNQFLSMDAQAHHPTEECKRIASEIAGFSSIELCVLGLGKNGHVGLNEPADELLPFCHINSLETSSQNHQMLQGSQQKVTQGMTLGIAEIMKAKKILLLVAGEGKTAAFEALKKGIVSTQLPASCLWLHPNVVVLIDEQSMT